MLIMEFQQQHMSLKNMKGDEEIYESESESSLDDSINSDESSSLDLVEDASSSSSTSSSSNGPLYELSELMSQLPIKRGLSKFYQGKSQSFTSLASVNNIEDLVKKARGHSSYNSRMKIKSCKSYAAGLDINGHYHHHQNNNNKSSSSYYSPKPTISKKSNSSTTTRASFLSLLGQKSSFVNSTTGFRASLPLQKNF